MQTKPIIVTPYWRGIGLAFHNNVISVLLHVHVKEAGQCGHLATFHWLYDASHLSKQRHWKHTANTSITFKVQIRWTNVCIPLGVTRSGEWMPASPNHQSDQVNECLHPWISCQIRWMNLCIPLGVTRPGGWMSISLQESPDQVNTLQESPDQVNECLHAVHPQVINCSHCLNFCKTKRNKPHQ